MGLCTPVRVTAYFFGQKSMQTDEQCMLMMLNPLPDTFQDFQFWKGRRQQAAVQDSRKVRVRIHT